MEQSYNTAALYDTEYIIQLPLIMNKYAWTKEKKTIPAYKMALPIYSLTFVRKRYVAWFTLPNARLWDIKVYN